MGIKIHIFEILKLNKFLYTVFPMALPRQGSGLQPVFRNPSGLSPEKNRKSFFGKRGKIKKVEGPDHGRRRSGPPSPTRPRLSNASGPCRRMGEPARKRPRRVLWGGNGRRVPKNLFVSRGEGPPVLLKTSPGWDVADTVLSVAASRPPFGCTGNAVAPGICIDAPWLETKRDPDPKGSPR
jgi:hypothetical protein